MKFGKFDDANREYVITTPKTPLPWINYLGSTDFFSLISNTGGGYSFYKDAKLLRLTRYRYNNIPNDEGGRYFYIKDGDTVWNPGWMPVKTDLDSYECHHGMGYIVGNLLNQLLVSVDNQDLVSQLIQPLGDAGAKASHADDNIRFFHSYLSYPALNRS